MMLSTDLPAAPPGLHNCTRCGRLVYDGSTEHTVCPVFCPRCDMDIADTGPHTTCPVCVYDFCGFLSPGHFPVSMWAFWHPDSVEVQFGGDWCEIPPMVNVTAPPDEATIEAWARAHGSDL